MLVVPSFGVKEVPFPGDPTALFFGYDTREKTKLRSQLQINPCQSFSNVQFR